MSNLGIEAELRHALWELKYELDEVTKQRDSLGLDFEKLKGSLAETMKQRDELRTAGDKLYEAAKFPHSNGELLLAVMAYGKMKAG